MKEEIGGTIGKLTWKLTDGNTLIISGNGDMQNYDFGFDGPNYYTDAPWVNERFKTVVIETGITSIGAGAFFYCENLTSIIIPNSVINIGENAFAGCGNLTSINIESENSSYVSEDGVLFNKSKTILICCPQQKAGKYTIPHNVKSIGNSAFSHCNNLTSIIIPNSVTSIGKWAFSHCNLTSILIPDSVTSIGNGAFLFCDHLTSILIPNSVTSIGANAFQSCKNLPSIVLPNNITSIEELTFYDCTSLTSIAIPNGVVSIGSWAFYKCTNLTSVTIPKSVVSFGSNAFTYCKNLKILTNLNPVPVNIGYNVFDGVNIDKCTLEVPMGSVAEYKEANIWKNFKIKGIDVGIAETDNYPSLRVYPNPTTGVLNLIQETINNEQLTINNIEIFDICGKKIFLSTRSLVHSSTITMDISHLTAGIYFVKISTETGEVVRKIVKQ